MEEIELEKYKKAWQQETREWQERLSEKEIYTYMQTSSKGLLIFFRNSIKLDLFFRLALLMALAGLVLMLSVGQPFKILLAGFALIIGLGLVWQVKILSKISDSQTFTKSTRQVLDDIIYFYHTHFVKAIYLIASSSTAFLLLASLYYLHFKYGIIPLPQADDLLVLGIGIGLSYGVSAFAYFQQSNFYIQQIEQIRNEIKDGELRPELIQQQQKARYKSNILLVLLLLLGLTIILFFIHNIIL